MSNPTTGEVIIFQAENGKTAIDVQLQNETVWLTQAQIAELFERERSVISKHLKNVFDTGELEEKSNVQKMHIANSDKPVAYYNLDVIISVGYRVNSKRGTQFRQWATFILRQHLVQGITLNEKRLREKNERLQEALRLVNNVMNTQQPLDVDQANSLLRVIQDYAYALIVLDDYDHQRLRITRTTPEELYQITYEEARQVIDEMRKRFGGSALFGREKDQSFKGSIATIYQSFGGEDLYPSLEEKAANLLYFVVKNHSFSDGNKRIAAVLFTWFLDKNKALYHTNGTRRLADNALVALTLMIAESKPEEKDMIIKVIVNLINQNN